MLVEKEMSLLNINFSMKIYIFSDIFLFLNCY